MELIEQYIKILPNRALQRIIDEPEEKWESGDHFRYSNGCRCLVGIAADFYAPELFRDKEAQQAGVKITFAGEGACAEYLPGKSVEYEFDRVFKSNGFAVAEIKFLASEELKNR